MKRVIHSLKLFIAGAALCAPACAATLDSVEQKLLEHKGQSATVMRTLAELTDDIGPRLTGGQQEAAAHRWAKAQFEALGLKSAHEPARVLPRSWQRGRSWGQLVKPNHWLQLAQLAWTPPTKGVARGPLVVLKARTEAELASYSDRLKGAIVVIGEPATGDLEEPLMRAPLRLQPAAPAASAAPVASAAPAARPLSRKALLAYASAHGAAAYLIDSSKPSAMLKADHGSINPGSTDLPGASVVHEQFLLLHRMAAKKAEIEIELSGHFGPEVQLYNTVAELPGSDGSGQFVILGAHIDSWDLASGATDNGAGVAAVIEAARRLVQSGARPKRSIRFVLFTGEEQGLWGSSDYVKLHAAELTNCSAVFVMDTGAGAIDAIALQSRRAVEATMLAVVEPLRAHGVVDTDLRDEGGTDHMPFDKAGVPAFCVEQVQHDYARDHHATSDSFDKVIPDELSQAASVLAFVAYRVAQLPAMLARER